MKSGELSSDARSDRFRLGHGRIHQVVHPTAVSREKQPIGIAESPHKFPLRDQTQRGDERVAGQKLLRAAVQMPQRDAADSPLAVNRRDGRAEANGNLIRLDAAVKNALEIWAKALDCPLDCAILPDGISCGKSLAEAEIPRSTILNRILHAPPDVLLASSGALLSPAPLPERMEETSFTVTTGMTPFRMPAQAGNSRQVPPAECPRVYHPSA